MGAVYMNGRVDVYFRVSALYGLLAVALGAFGAHGLHALLTQAGMVEIWKTAVFYHLSHAVLMIGLAWMGLSRKVWWCFASGVLLFSGSLYLLAVSGYKTLGYITPVGGVLLLAGWLALLLLPTRNRQV